MYNRKDGCKNTPENSPTTKVKEHIPSGFSKSTISSFRSMKNKHDVYRVRDCIKKFCEFLRETQWKKLISKRIKKKLLPKQPQ